MTDTRIDTLFWDVDETLLDFPVCERNALRGALEKNRLPFREEMHPWYHARNLALWKQYEKALNFQRSAARHGDTQTLPEDAPSPEASPEEALIQAERRAALHDALARLGQNDRALFYRKYYYLQSTAQIAAELGMTERAVEGRLYRLKKRLRTMAGRR